MAEEKKQDETVNGGAYEVEGVLVNAEGEKIEKQKQSKPEEKESK